MLCIPAQKPPVTGQRWGFRYPSDMRGSKPEQEFGCASSAQPDGRLRALTEYLRLILGLEIERNFGCEL